jgi:hypothetical protein
MKDLTNRIADLIFENEGWKHRYTDAYNLANMKILELPELKAIQVQAVVKPACEYCKYWLQRSELGDQRFGTCNNINTYSWVKGDAFEPYKDFSCVNFESKSV